ncbi:MAG: hypothetical protein Kow00121_30590 [Elainellaceae cyanobacterium]
MLQVLSGLATAAFVDDGGSVARIVWHGLCRAPTMVRHGLVAYGLTLTALGLAIAPLFAHELPLQWNKALLFSPLLGSIIHLASKPLIHRYQHVYALHCARRHYRLKRGLFEERAIALPHTSSHTFLPVGEIQKRIIAALNHGNCQVFALGELQSYTFRRYLFGVKHIGDYLELYGRRDFIKASVGCEGSPVFSFDRGNLAVDIPILDSERSFPLLSEFLGNSRVNIVIPVGVNPLRELETIDLDFFSHLRITGETRSGKSEWFIAFVEFLASRHTPDEVTFAIIDLKQGVTFEPSQWELLPHLVGPVATTVEAGLCQLAKVHEEVQARFELFRESHVANIKDYNHRAAEPLPHLFVIIDEAVSFVDSPSYFELFKRIARPLGQKAAAAGVHLLFGYQRSAVEFLPTEIRSNLGTLICLKVGTVQDSMIALAGGEHEFNAQEGAYLKLKGDMLYRKGGDIVRLQGLKVNLALEDAPIRTGGWGVDLWELPQYDQVVQQYGVTVRGSTAQTTAAAIGDSPQVQQAIYQQYRRLREAPKPPSMTAAMKQIPQLRYSSGYGAAYQEARSRLDNALYAHLQEWVMDLLEAHQGDMTDESIVKFIWSDRLKASDAERHKRAVFTIRAERGLNA